MLTVKTNAFNFSIRLCTHPHNFLLLNHKTTSDIHTSGAESEAEIEKQFCRVSWVCLCGTLAASPLLLRMIRSESAPPVSDIARAFASFSKISFVSSKYFSRRNERRCHRLQLALLYVESIGTIPRWGKSNFRISQQRVIVVCLIFAVVFRAAAIALGHFCDVHTQKRTKGQSQMGKITLRGFRNWTSVLMLLYYIEADGGGGKTSTGVCTTCRPNLPHKGLILFTVDCITNFLSFITFHFK